MKYTPVKLEEYIITFIITGAHRFNRRRDTTVLNAATQCLTLPPLHCTIVVFLNDRGKTTYIDIVLEQAGKTK